MATVNLVNDPESVVTGNDNIVIVSVEHTIRGGASLDVTGFTPTVIPAGHVIIRETATGEYKPMPVVGSGAIEALGAIAGGSDYDNGTYPAVSLTGGSGSGATAKIVVEDGEAVSVDIVNAGSGYEGGDSLSAGSAIGDSGTGFSVAVSEVGDDPTDYGSLPGGHVYAGILIASILKARPFAGIMYDGVVNPAASRFPLTSIQSAVSTALPHIKFVAD